MNRPVHFEIHSNDPERDLAFYQQTLGWTAQKWEGGSMEYWLITTGPEGSPGINGGLMRSPDGQPRTVNTAMVENVDAAAAKVTGAGGQIVVPRMPIPGMGWLVYCTDPTGNIFGMMESDPSAA
jgi:predicted enzyme related to lactoylglutathione lyase